MLFIFALGLVSVVSFVSARRLGAETTTITEAAARAHGALWIQVRDLVRSQDRTLVQRMAGIAASRSRHNGRYRALASVLGAELHYAQS